MKLCYGILQQVPSPTVLPLATLELYHNIRRDMTKRDYSIGDLVWLHVPAVKPGRTKKFASQSAWTLHHDRMLTTEYSWWDHLPSR